MKEITV